jgi:hypothetical protein
MAARGRAGRRQAAQSELGTVQGGSISPLLANIYLHYAFDLWVKQWRGRHARGDVIVVRYADDWIAGFQHRDDAERFWRAVVERLGQFGLKLHPDKTRLIEFGRFARDNRRRRDKANRTPSTSWASRTAAARRGEGSSWCWDDQRQAPARQAAGGQDGVAEDACTAHRRAGPVPARGGGWAWPLLRRALQRGARCRPSASRWVGCGIARCAAAVRPST